MPRYAPKAAEAGLSLLELLVALGMLGIALSAAVAFASTQMRLMRQNHLRVEVRQAVRATGDAVVRDLRLAAACLPQTGRFVSLAGVDGGTADSITIRTGFAQDDMSCVATATNQLHTLGATTITVDQTTGFELARMGYIRHIDGDGEFFVIADVDPMASTITRGDPATRDFPVGSGVFAVDERTYALDAVADPPQLTLEIDRGGVVPFAVGIDAFDVRYVLARNCPPCDQVDMPVDDAEWRLVNEVALTVTASTVNPIRSEDSYSETRTVTGKPRNLLP
jgi:type II secretory pathway pseudopilin PulG